MDNIHHFVLRSTPSRGAHMAEPAEVIIFPGVRFERGERIGEGSTGSRQGRLQPGVRRATTKDD